MDRTFELQGLSFEWDEEKYASNLWKHDIKFEEEAREFIVGFSFRFNLLYTVFVERGERIRISSARRATNEEERYYAKRK